MRAIDTNVLVRLIVADNEAQAQTAERLATEPFLVLPTVVLETVWVLEKSYRMGRADVSGRLSDLLGNANAVVISASAVDGALNQYSQGADFADALHVMLAEEADASTFATFDRGMVKTLDVIGVQIETLA